MIESDILVALVLRIGDNMIRKYKGIEPKVHENCFIAEECTITGDVTIGEKSNVWFYSVIRGDTNSIKIGKYTNIQDGAIIHVDAEYPTNIGDYVTIGHGAKLHGCTVGDNALIGIGAIILDGAEIGKGAMVAAGCLVPPNKKIPENVLVVGNPCKIIRDVTEEEKTGILNGCLKYANVYSQEYK